MGIPVTLQILDIALVFNTFCVQKKHSHGITKSRQDKRRNLRGPTASIYHCPLARYEGGIKSPCVYVDLSKAAQEMAVTVIIKRSKVFKQQPESFECAISHECLGYYI